MAHTMVIFGASGDLTSRKLIPALYRLFQRKRLPPDTRILGVARSAFSDEEWRKQLRATTEKYLKGFDAQVWDEFEKYVHYLPADINSGEDFHKLGARCSELELHKPTARVYYLATMPQLYEAAIAQLGAADWPKMMKVRGELWLRSRLAPT